MLNTKKDAAKNSASLELLKNRWLSVHSACKQVTLLFLPWLGHRLTSTWRSLLTTRSSHFVQLITFEDVAQILYRGSQMREKCLLYQNIQKYFFRLTGVVLCNYGGDWVGKAFKKWWSIT